MNGGEKWLITYKISIVYYMQTMVYFKGIYLVNTGKWKVHNEHPQGVSGKPAAGGIRTGAGNLL